MARYRLAAPDKNCLGVAVGDRRYLRQTDGTFHVDNPAHAKRMVEMGECFNAGMQFGQGKPGWICQRCSHIARVVNHCPICGSMELEREHAV